MNIQVQTQLHTTDYRGDHSREASIVLDTPNNTTTQQLGEMFFKKSKNPEIDYLTIRFGIKDVQP